MSIVNKSEELRKDRKRKKIFFAFALMVLLTIITFVIGIVNQMDTSSKINGMKSEITNSQKKVTDLEEAIKVNSEKIEKL